MVSFVKPSQVNIKAGESSANLPLERKCTA